MPTIDTSLCSTTSAFLSEPQYSKGFSRGETTTTSTRPRPLSPLLSSAVESCATTVTDEIYGVAETLSSGPGFLLEINRRRNNNACRNHKMTAKERNVILQDHKSTKSKLSRYERDAIFQLALDVAELDADGDDDDDSGC